MTTLGWCRFWCLAVALATVPMQAEEERSSAPPHSIAEGSTLLIRLEDKLDVSRVRPGKRFNAKLAEDLVGPDEIRVLRGSRVRGHVSGVGSGFHPQLLLSFDEIETPHGWAPLMAIVIGVPGEHGLTADGGEGAIERQGSNQRRDPDSEGTSSKAGAAAGVVRAIFSDHTLLLPKGTILELRLDRALQVPWR